MATKKQVAYLPDDDQPRLCQAVGLAVALMKAAKVHRWSDFGGEIPEPLVLLPGQLELLHEFEDVISLTSAPVRASEDSKAKAQTLVFCCPECGSWGLISSGGAPSSCTMSLSCEQFNKDAAPDDKIKPVKAKLAKKVDPLKPESWAHSVVRNRYTAPDPDDFGDDEFD